MDASTYTVRIDENWWIKGDSIFSFKYPCEYQTSFRFSIANDSIYFDDSKKAAAHLRFNDQVLIMTGTNPQKQDNIKKYFRAEFDEKIVNQLKRDSLNPDCITGKMELLTVYFPSNGEAEEHKYPIPLPKNLTINTTKSAVNFFEKKSITIHVNGKKRLFYLDNIYWNGKLYNQNISENTIINLKPAEWWTGEEFTVQYMFLK